MGHALKKYNGIVYMKFGKMQRIEGYNILFRTNIRCIYFLKGIFFDKPSIWRAKILEYRSHDRQCWPSKGNTDPRYLKSSTIPKFSQVLNLLCKPKFYNISKCVYLQRSQHSHIAKTWQLHSSGNLLNPSRFTSSSIFYSNSSVDESKSIVECWASLLNVDSANENIWNSISHMQRMYHYVINAEVIPFQVIPCVFKDA